MLRSIIGRRKPGRQRPAAVAPWSRAERAADRVPDGGGDRGRGPRADDAPGSDGAGPVVARVAAALHGLGARRAPGNPPGAAALAPQARALASGGRARRPG